ncbi:M20/M25/M40 family metallo-hydrolase [Brevundimonas aurifodinae]|uniref:Vacuolar membrane protease n=2 Tax=Brevundimonas TaxID=41275 RepID=A0ABV1NM38_9CAUL|nr:MAG: peptidase M20 [Brevundimonas sp. 12-68-7]OYX32451.1 MAG: peptidase M20 [Brevundimonas subvibrioides]
MRWGLFLGSLFLALAIGVWALQVPSPRPTTAPAVAFSAERAMVDVRAIGARPHPVGSADHARVRDYLFQRMTALGLSPAFQAGALSPDAVVRLERWGGDPAAAGNQAVNIVGVLPGRDPTAAAVLMMAHYDSAWDSPGAADDGAGVAAILEAVRALQARGTFDRSLVVLITDAEELNLDGARIFFSEHPLRDRIGSVVNLEARGGGGRAMMFETGRGNAETIDLFARVAARADGGVTSNALSIFVYETMPNGTDFTIPKNRGIGGLNFAFIGRPALYHTPEATPDNLDRGALQHIGSQALEATDALLTADALPIAGRNAVYGDVLGRFLIVHAPGFGWSLLALTAALGAFAAWGARHRTGLQAMDVGRGMLSGLWLIAMGVVVTQGVRVLAGPTAGRAESAEAYYTLLRRLPWMEAGAVLAVVAVALAGIAGRAALGPRLLAGVVIAAVAAATLLGGFDPIVMGAGGVAIALSAWSQSAPRTPWGAWLGLIALIFLLGCIAQAAAPEAALVFVWPGLLAALAAAASALIGASLKDPRALIPAAIATILGGAWVVTLAHPVFLGVGMDLPAVLILMALLVLLFARPLAPEQARATLAAGAAACLILACGLSLTARFAEPMPPPIEGGPT